MATPVQITFTTNARQMQRRIGIIGPRVIFSSLVLTGISHLAAMEGSSLPVPQTQAATICQNCSIFYRPK